MISKSKLKDYIGFLYYRHGLFCASNPISCLLVVGCVVILSCYPLTFLTSFNSSLEKYSQSTNDFDGHEANTEFSKSIHFEKYPDRPAWYNHVPVGYIQRIIVKSILSIPEEHTAEHSTYYRKNPHPGQSLNESTEAHQRNHQLYLIDAFRTSIAQLFDINEFLRNFHTSNEQDGNKKSLVSDMCLHVGELKAFKAPTDIDPNNEAKNYFPEFNCLYLSPTNYWSNDYNSFMNDYNLMMTINRLNDLQMMNNIEKQENTDKGGNFIGKFVNSFMSLLDRIDLSSNTILEKVNSTRLSEILFGVSWNSILSLLKDNPNLVKSLKKSQQFESIDARINKSIVFTYAITIAFKKYDRPFIEELKTSLRSKFSLFNEFVEDESIINLQYTNQSLMYYIPYLVLYILLFLYIYISVRKIEFVKSKWGLAFAAVSQVMASLLMAIGICTYFGVTPTLNGGEIFPYLIIFIGFENIVVLTKSVVSTPFDLDVRYRIALGLKKESWLITKILTFELIIICFGFFTMVPAIQEFCIFAYVGLLIDFFMQMIFFVTVLSIDIRRMELSDLNKQYSEREENKSVMEAESVSDQIERRKKQTNEYIAKFGDLITPNEIENKLIYRRGNPYTSRSDLKDAKCKKSNTSSSSKKAFSLTSTSVQFFYFWAQTRLVQRALMIMTVLWIILIFYKSLLVVELMRHDVNISRETAEALLPKNRYLDTFHQYYDNFHQVSSQTSASKLEKAKTPTTTVNYLQRNFYDFLTIRKSLDTSQSMLNPASTEHNWQSLNYYHWLTLFHNYNVSLYNRYVALLPEITLNRVIKHADILKYRNRHEIKSQNSFLVMHNNEIFVNNSNSNRQNSNQKATEINLNERLEKMNLDEDLSGTAKKEVESVFIKWAIFELVGIVVLGIPTIFVFLYLMTLFYKCLCSKRYEEWRKSWSTSSIKRQYKKIHRGTVNDTSCSAKTRKRKNSDEIMDDDDQCSTTSSRRSDSSSDSDYESCKIVDGPVDIHSNQNDSGYEQKMNKQIDKDVLLNKIINGQKDDVDLTPVKYLNSEHISKLHKYPIDLISYGTFKCATCDINNQIIIWSLNISLSSTENECLQAINLNLIINKSQDQPNIAIWSLCLTSDDKYLFVGQSNGEMRVFNLQLTTDDHTQNKVYHQEASPVSTLNNGITHIVNYKNLFPNSYLMDLSIENNYRDPSESLYVVIIRLNGFIELIKYNEAFPSPSLSPCFQSMFSIRAHMSPVTQISSNSSHFITTSQDCTFRVFKFCVINNDLAMEIVLTEQLKSEITSIAIQDTYAALGTRDGLIYLWNLAFGRCEFCLCRPRPKDRMEPETIIKLLIVQDLVISLNEDHQMCIWNRKKGKLIKEFTFFAPKPTNKSVLESFLSSDLLNLLALKYTAAKHEQLKNPLDNPMLFQSPPTMCMYSKNLLITSGCSCIFIWNISNGGELVKKINLIKPVHINKTPMMMKSKNQQSSYLKSKTLENKYSQKFYVKQISLIVQKSFDTPRNGKGSPKVVKNKVLLITDYTDTIYVLKIPSYIFQELDLLIN